ncbi:MAG: TorF family putative porin, partial [Hylemonella sp.]
MKHLSKISIACLALIAGTSAMAQSKPAEPDFTLAYNIGAVSDYRFRGITQTANQASIQGGIDFAHKNGVYLGAWAASNLKWIKEFNGASKGDYEVDLYGGYKFNAMGLGFDLGAITYQYPGNDSGATGTTGSGSYSKADTTEAYVGVSYGPVTLKYSQSFGDFLGNLNSNGSRYWDLSANLDLGNGLSLVPHVGRQTVPNQTSGSVVGNAADYTDYAITLNKDFGKGLSA